MIKIGFEKEESISDQAIEKGGGEVRKNFSKWGEWLLLVPTITLQP